MKDIDKILKRAQKILNLANGTDFKEEADTALRMVEKMLAKYNLSMSDIKIESDAQQPGVKKEKTTNRNGSPWQRQLYRSCAHLYACEYLYATWYNGKIDHFLIGKSHNIAVAMQIATYVIKTIYRLARKELKEFEDSQNYTPSGFRTSFFKGASQSVCEKIQKILDNRDKESEQSGEGNNDINKDMNKNINEEQEMGNQSTALAVVMINELQLAKDFVSQNIATTTVRARRTFGSINNYGAFERGMAAGNSISLNTQIE